MSPDIDQFDYQLPLELIATEPLANRSGSRLLVVDRTGRAFYHSVFASIGQWLKPGDLLVVNNARVVPARLFGFKESGGKAEVFLLRRFSEDGTLPPWPSSDHKVCDRWVVMISPARGLNPGHRLSFRDSALICTVEKRLADGNWVARFSGVGDLMVEFERIGYTPLPPYIIRARRKRGGMDLYTNSDRTSYQTVYASRSGAVAAPTAGLHFTSELLSGLKSNGIEIAEITLLVGPGTFKPVNVRDYTKHILDPEFYIFPEDACGAIRSAREERRRIVAVGTTTCRVLEHVAVTDRWFGHSDWTDLFIYPPYEFRVVDALITNFHLPRSSLLLLVSAFAGREFIMQAYEEAVKMRYRFYSYGDAMFIF